MPAARTIAIGDIHGCLDALKALIRTVNVQSTDTLILLGDYIDRGPDARGVLDLLMELRRKCRMVPLMGNHEKLLLDPRRQAASLRELAGAGGRHHAAIVPLPDPGAHSRALPGVSAELLPLLRDARASAGARQLHSQFAAGGATIVRTALGITAAAHARPTLLRQEGRARSHHAKGRGGA